MPRHRTPALRLTALEGREVPSAVGLGSGWVDPENLTLSFAPDGAAIGTVGSDLNTALDAVAPRAVWQREVLRAFQTWAVQTNLHVGLVADGPAALGTPGEFQGDGRFGDIRVGGRPLSADAWANAAVVDWASGTWAGDVVFNTALPFAVRPPAGSAAADLFTIALHEAGHAFGLEHSPVPGSALSENYQGPRAGLSVTDIQAVQAAHGGPRRPDRHEGRFGNDTRATATPLAGSGLLAVAGDITKSGDLDHYTFTVPAGVTRFGVHLQTSGLSLLTARVTVLDPAGRAVEAAAATDPAAGDIVLDIPNAVGGTAYTVRVEGASADVFGLGRYQMTVAFTGQVPARTAFPTDGGADDTPAGATPLAAAPPGRGAGEVLATFGANGVIETPTDADYYRLSAPAGFRGAVPALVVRVQSLRDDRPAPRVALFDGAMNPVPVRVLGDSGDRLVVRLPVVRPGAAYYLRLAGDGTPAGMGNYRLTADLVTPSTGSTVERDRLASGYLAPDRATIGGTLRLASSALFQFNLGSAEAAGGAGVTLTVTDSAGQVVLSLSKAGDDPDATASVYLGAGEYTVTLTLTAPAGASDPGLWVWLDGGLASDPAGTYPTTTGSSSTTTTTTTTTRSGSTTYAYSPTTSTSTTTYDF